MRRESTPLRAPGLLGYIITMQIKKIGPEKLLFLEGPFKMLLLNHNRSPPSLDYLSNSFNLIRTLPYLSQFFHPSKGFLSYLNYLKDFAVELSARTWYKKTEASG